MPDIATPPTFDVMAMAAGMATRQHDADAVPLGQLLEPRRLAALLERHCRLADGTRPAAASLWSQVCFNVLLIPTVTLLLTRNGEDPAPPCFDSCRVSFCPISGLARHLVLYDSTPEPDLAPADVLQRMVMRHVAPLIAALAPVAGLADRVVWENVGFSLAWTLNAVSQVRPDRISMCRSMADRLNGPASAARAMTQLRYAVHARLPYRRRTCCLRYRLPGSSRCEGICPMEPDACRRPA